MTVAEILCELNAIAPVETAEPWDNVGLLVGDATAEVKRALVCLDITGEVVDAAVAMGAQLIVSHHPVIFAPLSALTANSVPYRLAKAGIAAIAAHTNLDKAEGGINDRLVEALGWQAVRGCDALCRLVHLPQPMSAKELAGYISGTLGTAVRLRAGVDAIATLAVVGGSGGDYAMRLGELGADALLTGEVKHHEWLAAGKHTVIDAGHAATERVVVEPLAQMLCARVPSVEWKVAVDELPYETVLS